LYGAVERVERGGTSFFGGKKKDKVPVLTRRRRPDDQGFALARCRVWVHAWSSAWLVQVCIGLQMMKLHRMFGCSNCH
jgi:hypothetical protein